MKKIALEEHFMAPEFLKYFASTKVNISHTLYDRAVEALSDFGERRLAQMDAGGVSRAILSLAGPGVQAEASSAVAVRLAHHCNDLLAEEIQKVPDRYGGFGHLAMQDPVAAADELERCVTQLGFQGAMINGQTNGAYLDDDRFSVFWERAAALGAPIYIHPNNPPDVPFTYHGHSELWGPVWSWMVETGTHALRLVFSGVFERYPNAQIIIGHMGETLPFQLWRFDSRWLICNRGEKALERPPSHYIRSNIKITTSGVFSVPPLMCAIDALGEDNVMFSIDYPFERADLSSEFIQAAPLSDAVRAKICHGNAERILKLPAT
jgi:2,3-dihydroxybenzoate decarboxylase